MISDKEKISEKGRERKSVNNNLCILSPSIESNELHVSIPSTLGR